MAQNSKFVVAAVASLGFSVAGCGSSGSVKDGETEPARESEISRTEKGQTPCESVISPEKVTQICGHPFVLSDKGVETKDRRCSVELLSEEFGSKYGANGVSPTVKYVRVFMKRGANGRDMAKLAYDGALNREKERDNFENDVSDLGTAAFRAKVSISRNVYWYDGDYFHTLSVDDGHTGDSNYQPYCPPDKLPELAREIYN